MKRAPESPLQEGTIFRHLSVLGWMRHTWVTVEGFGGHKCRVIDSVTAAPPPFDRLHAFAFTQYTNAFCRCAQFGCRRIYTSLAYMSPICSSTCDPLISGRGRGIDLSPPVQFWLNFAHSAILFIVHPASTCQGLLFFKVSRILLRCSSIAAETSPTDTSEEYDKGLAERMSRPFQLNWMVGEEMRKWDMPCEHQFSVIGVVITTDYIVSMTDCWFVMFVRRVKISPYKNT